MRHRARVGDGPSTASPRMDWALNVAKMANPDPTGWWERAREPSASVLAAIASALVNDPAIDGQPASVTLLLAIRLQRDEVAPQRAQRISARTMPWLRSSMYAIWARSTGS